MSKRGGATFRGWKEPSDEASAEWTIVLVPKPKPEPEPEEDEPGSHGSLA